MSVQFASVYPMILDILSPRIGCTTFAVGEAIQMRQFTWEMFSSRMEGRRKEANYTITDIERGIGMNNVYYRNWELGKKKPNVISTFAKLCIFLETDPRYFLGLIDLPDITDPHYQPLKTTEANAIADIVDSISDEFYRKRLLTIAEMEVELVLHTQNVIKEKNEKIISLLGNMIDVSSDTKPSTNHVDSLATTEPINVSDKRHFNWEKFGMRLKLRREEKGYTQEDVTQNTGMSRSYYANWEASRKTPGALVNFVNVCLFLQTDPRYFLCISDSPDPNTSYVARRYPESNRIAALVDTMPTENRERSLLFARSEKAAAEMSERIISAKNSRIIGLLQDLIGAVGAEVALTHEKSDKLIGLLN